MASGIVWACGLRNAACVGWPHTPSASAAAPPPTPWSTGRKLAVYVVRDEIVAADCARGHERGVDTARRRAAATSSGR
jgi:hypothetical protein